MEPNDFLKLLHVLTFVYWLGADLGVFYAARVAAGPRLAVDTRAALFKVMTWIDLIPRMMLILTFPVGAQLAAGLGISPIVGGWLWLVWIGAIAWAVLLFAGAVACGVGVRVTLKPLAGALERLGHEEENTDSVASMARAVRASTPFAAGLWILIVAAAFTGLNHETLFGT